MFLSRDTQRNGFSRAPIGMIGAAAFWFAAIGVPAAVGANITTFDPPGSLGTFATSINAAGWITGSYIQNSANRGYLRAPDGTFTSFDADSANQTIPVAINANGVVAGSYYDSNYQVHGFVRGAKGKITPFDPPQSMNTEPIGMNDAGAVVGYFVDTADVWHSFLRAADGTVAAITPEGSTGRSACRQHQRRRDGIFPRPRRHLSRFPACAGRRHQQLRRVRFAGNLPAGH